MKRITIWTIATVAVVLTGLIIVRAEAWGRNDWRAHEWHHAWPGKYLARELNLSDAQKTQIKALLQAERPIFSAQIRELLAENKAMNAMSVQESPDQKKLDEMAQREATTIAALLTEKQHLQTKIYSTVLNSDQRAKAIELQKRWESRLDHVVDRLETQPAR
jgi:Spy/CpxP family protein refolding chaperone